MKEFIDKLISRLEELRGHICNCMPCDGCKYIGDCNEGEFAEDVALDKAIEIVNELAEEYKGGWIPCSERLPEYTDEYNVTVDVASEFGCYKTVKTLRFERIKGKEPKWAIPKDEVYRVLAWCERPAPYTEGE